MRPTEELQIEQKQYKLHGALGDNGARTGDEDKAIKRPVSYT